MGAENMKDVATKAVDGFLKYAHSRRYCAHTIRQYDYTLRKLMPFLAARDRYRLQDVSRDDLEAFHRHLQETGMSLGSQENIMRATQKFFRWLEAGGKVFVDPTADLAMPRRGNRMVIVPTEEEMARLLAQPDTASPIGIRDRALMEIAYGCGLRRSELAGLSVQDPDPEQATLRVRGKGRKQRMVPLGKQALHWLDLYLKEAWPKLLSSKGGSASGVRDQLDDSSGADSAKTEKALWITEKHTPLEGGSIRQQVRRYVEKAGIRTPMNLHSLRKACATHMLAHGAHPVQIQMLLGHASLGHLNQYLSVTITDLKKSHHQSNPGH